MRGRAGRWRGDPQRGRPLPAPPGRHLAHPPRRLRELVASPLSRLSARLPPRVVFRRRPRSRRQARERRAQHPRAHREQRRMLEVLRGCEALCFVAPLCQEPLSRRENAALHRRRLDPQLRQLRHHACDSREPLRDARRRGHRRRVVGEASLLALAERLCEHDARNLVLPEDLVLTHRDVEHLCRHLAQRRVGSGVGRLRDGVEREDRVCSRGVAEKLGGVDTRRPEPSISKALCAAGVAKADADWLGALAEREREALARVARSGESARRQIVHPMLQPSRPLKGRPAKHVVAQLRHVELKMLHWEPVHPDQVGEDLEDLKRLGEFGRPDVAQRGGALRGAHARQEHAHARQRRGHAEAEEHLLDDGGDALHHGERIRVVPLCLPLTPRLRRLPQLRRLRRRPAQRARGVGRQLLRLPAPPRQQQRHARSVACL
mmetsp:Transcript_3185/g.10985  ORF Transcript_3185/g.10985 Transcript_3185/m.10985 type:complete len:434 (+) Transcript_3185:142-1443(+)